MTSIANNVSYSHYYHGNSDIYFNVDDENSLEVSIDTERLHIRSVKASESDYQFYAALFGDIEVMQKFATGETKSKEDMQKRINDVWVKRWNQNDPYTGLAVFKNDTEEFVGHVVLGHGDAPGQSELAYLFAKRFWGNGIGTETVKAVVTEYAPATIKEGYTLDGKPLEKITATTRDDNPASVKILINLGMHPIGYEEKYGALRHHFSINIDEVIHRP